MVAKHKAFIVSLILSLTLGILTACGGSTSGGSNGLQTIAY